MRGPTRAAATLALVIAAALAPSLRADEPGTPSEAKAAWRDWVGTRMMRPGVDEAGREAITRLTEGGVAPAEALAIALAAAGDLEWSAEKIQGLTTEIVAQVKSGQKDAALARKAWAHLGKERPAKPEEADAEPPGARTFARGEGRSPAGRMRWQGGDLAKASAHAGSGPGALVWGPLDTTVVEGAAKGAKVERYVAYLVSEASTWWESDLAAFWKGEDARFVAGAVLVPTGEEARFAVSTRSAPRWRAAYIFADVGGRRVLLAPEAVSWLDGADAAKADGKGPTLRVDVGG